MCYGYEPVESKNEYMRSYSNGIKRINYYFGKGTVQVQRHDGLGRKGGEILRNPSGEELENFL